MPAACKIEKHFSLNFLTPLLQLLQNWEVSKVQRFPESRCHMIMNSYENQLQPFNPWETDLTKVKWQAKRGTLARSVNGRHSKELIATGKNSDTLNQTAIVSSQFGSVLLNSAEILQVWIGAISSNLQDPAEPSTTKCGGWGMHKQAPSNIVLRWPYWLLFVLKKSRKIHTLPWFLWIFPLFRNELSKPSLLGGYDHLLWTP